MSNLQRVLIGLLVLQLALVALVFWPRQASSVGSEPLLGTLTADDVTGLRITDDQGRTAALAKQGDAWVAPDAGAYPADAAKITPLLTKLAEITTDRLVTQTPASHAQLQVADGKFARRIDLTGADGATQTVYLGTPGGSQAVHVRRGGANEVYLARGLATWEVGGDLVSWIDPVYLSVAAADITTFTLTNANGQLVLTRGEDGTWQLGGLAADEALDANKVSSLVNAVTSLRMTAPIGKDEDASWGLAQPTATVAMQVKSGDQTKSITLLIGASDEASSSYVVKSSESEYYARVAEFSVDALVSQDRAGLLAAAPTPAATP
jgi:hypothetical protein